MGLVDIELLGEDANLKLTFQMYQEKLVRAEAMDGHYPLGINDSDLSAPAILARFRKQVAERRIEIVTGPVRVYSTLLHQ